MKPSAVRYRKTDAYFCVLLFGIHTRRARRSCFQQQYLCSAWMHHCDLARMLYECMRDVIVDCVCTMAKPRHRTESVPHGTMWWQKPLSDQVRCGRSRALFISFVHCLIPGYSYTFCTRTSSKLYIRHFRSFSLFLSLFTSSIMFAAV